MKILNNKGQGLTEYITLLVLVSLIAVGATQKLGKSIKTRIERAKTHISSHVNLNAD